MMRVIVCVKSVLIVAPKGAVARSLDVSELNPYDRPALALGLGLAEEAGGEVVAVSMGPEEVAGDALLEAMALGASSAALALDPAFAGSDTLATSTILAAAVEKLRPFDLLLFGVRTLDSDTGHVGPQTAERLGLPLVTMATAVTAGEQGFLVERKADGYHQTYELDPPGAVTVLPAAAPVIDAPLGGIQTAYAEGVYQKWSLADLGLSADEVGLEGSPTRVASITSVSRERECELLAGTTEEQADELVKRMQDDGTIG